MNWEISPDFDAYAEGRITVAQIRCVLCKQAPCDCPEFGSKEYIEMLYRVHGKEMEK